MGELRGTLPKKKTYNSCMSSKTERLATLIKELRGKQSQRSFAKQLGVSRASIQFWESQMAWPESENLEKLAALKGWNLEEVRAYLIKGQLPSYLPLEQPLEQILNTVRSLPFEAAAIVAAAAVETMAIKGMNSGQGAVFLPGLQNRTETSTSSGGIVNLTQC